jgi:O-methyltransferase involved in polyketide biosynthesis
MENPMKAATEVTSAVLSKKEQDQWVAKIQQMLVKGSTLAAQMETGTGEHEQEHHNCGAINHDCCLFGKSFQAINDQHDVSACHCCESDDEQDDSEEDEIDISFLDFSAPSF